MSALRALLPDKFIGCAKPELMDDHRPFELRHPQRIRARRRLVREALAVAIWRTRRREQPNALAISRRPRPAARRRLISSCLSTVSFLRAIQLSRSWCATTVLDYGVTGPRSAFGG